MRRKRIAAVRLTLYVIGASLVVEVIEDHPMAAAIAPRSCPEPFAIDWISEEAVAGVAARGARSCAPASAWRQAISVPIPQPL